jgi:hypothetical protein
MTPSELRSKYPTFKYLNFSYKIEDSTLECKFTYSLPPDHTFTHQVTFENIQAQPSSNIDSYIFNLGLAEMFSYWKLTCSPQVIIEAGHLSNKQLQFWHNLFIQGMGQYYYENNIDFTSHQFITLTSTGNPLPPPSSTQFESNSVLVPLGGGKDSLVTAELLKHHYHITPIIVTPTTLASFTPSQMLVPTPPVVVHRQLDSFMLELTKSGYLTGHIPYSSVLAFIFVLVAGVKNINYIAVSNEASSDEGNVEYLGHIINHQYTKSSEFEIDFQTYLSNKSTHPIHYFSFLRPLHELQIGKLFSKYPQYFPIFKSCNKNQQKNSWCGRCSKCVSIALALIPWLGEDTVTNFMGTNPLTDPANALLISQMTDPTQIKPFECIVSTHEANICQEFIAHGQTSSVQEFLSQFHPSHMPSEFLKILKSAYENS